MTRSESIELTTIITPLRLFLLLVRLGGYIVNSCDFYFYGLIGKLTAFFAASGVHLVQTDRDLFNFRHTSFSSQLKTRVVLVLTKVADLCISLNLDGAPITSKSHNHPSHS
jgi:hypothetical protein